MNSKRVTSQDVANRAGVSRTTVSLVLNNVKDAQISDETRKKVLMAATELDYHPDASARRLVQGRSQVIGFVERHSPFQNFADAFMAEVLRGLHGVARQHNYHVLFEPTSEKREAKNDFMRLIRERHADGIVLSGPRFDDQLFFQRHAQNAPIVLQGRLPGSNLPSVDVDNVGGARLATDHLLALGYRKIAMITNGPLAYTAAADRRSGYLQALQEAGIEFAPKHDPDWRFQPREWLSRHAALVGSFILDPRRFLSPVMWWRSARSKLPDRQICESRMTWQLLALTTYPGQPT